MTTPLTLGALKAFMKACNWDAYEKQKIAKEESKSGLVVSTVFTPDCGYETAVIDFTETVYPVERYPDKEAAEIGHKKWMAFADICKHNTKVIMLGWSVLPSREVSLNLKGKKE